MKKLMVLMAGIALAVSAQAVAFNWSASGVKDITGLLDYSGTFTLMYTVKDADAWSSYTTGSMVDGAFVIDDADTSLTGGTTYSFYYTMTDASGNIFTSDTKNGKANTSAATRYVSFTGGSWAAVPEPTSGLLMVLGIAGLALRRRHT